MLPLSENMANRTLLALVFSLLSHCCIVTCQLCWCNNPTGNATNSCEAFNNPVIPPPATGTCQNTHGCVYRYQLRSGSKLSCANRDVAEVSEYNILNGEVYSMHHVCRDHLCRPEFALSVLDCPWVMAPTDPGGQQELQCKCNQGLNCVEGECNYNNATIPDDMMPACRFWHVDSWTQPIIDCWYTTQAYDRQVYLDSETTYTLCRDDDYCNDQPAVLKTLRSPNHCPLFAMQAFRQKLKSFNPTGTATPPSVDRDGTTIVYNEIPFDQGVTVHYDSREQSAVSETSAVTSTTAKLSESMLNPNQTDNNVTDVVDNDTTTTTTTPTTTPTTITESTTTTTTTPQQSTSDVNQLDETSSNKDTAQQKQPPIQTNAGADVVILDLRSSEPKHEHRPDESMWSKSSFVALTLSFAVVVCVFVLSVAVYACSLLC